MPGQPACVNVYPPQPTEAFKAGFDEADYVPSPLPFRYSWFGVKSDPGYHDYRRLFFTLERTESCLDDLGDSP